MQELKEIDDVMRKVNVEGCIPAIQAFIERNLYTVGGIAIAIALSQVLSFPQKIKYNCLWDSAHINLSVRCTNSFKFDELKKNSCQIIGECKSFSIFSRFVILGENILPRGWGSYQTNIGGGGGKEQGRVAKEKGNSWKDWGKRKVKGQKNSKGKT